MFTTRELKSGDAEMANEWLSGWRKYPLPIGMYPKKGLVLLDSDNNPIYVGFVWSSDSDMAMLGFITRNPNSKKLPNDTRTRFCKSLDDYAQNDLGFKHIITWTDNKFLVNDFKELGFRETSNKVSELINYKI